MIHILIPLAGKSLFFDSAEYPFPKPLIEIKNKLMIQWVIENFSDIQEEKEFIFVVNKEDCAKFHLDNVLQLLTDNKCKIIRLSGETKGAACSCLMAIEYIDNTDKLIIVNGDQIIERSIKNVLSELDSSKVDGGVICFESVHPKWSYVRLDENQKIVETAEKRPISKHAIAGFYYFREGKEFVSATMKSIQNDASCNGLYFIAPTLNEMVLNNKSLKIVTILSKDYHSFYSPQKIKEYERVVYRTEGDNT